MRRFIIDDCEGVRMSEIVYIRTSGIFDDSRATKEIMSLGKAGHFVHVLSWERYGNAKDKNDKIFEEYPNIDFYYFRQLIPDGIGLKNIGKLIAWFKWINKTLKKFQNITVIHACNLDTVIPVLKYCKKTGSKLIYDIFDYYVDSHNIPSFLRIIVERKEIDAINYAEATIICTEERREQIAKARPKQIVVVHNAPDIDAPYNNDICYDYVYCGALCSQRLVAEILDAYPKHSDLKFFFAGYGEYVERCKSLAEKYPSFIFHEAMPYKQVLEIESSARCLSAIYEPSMRNHRLCAPNKFYEALALGKPVIVCAGTGIDKIVNSLQCGEIIDYNADSFYKAVEKIKESKIADNRYNEDAERKKYETEYSWSIMEKRIVEMYNAVTERC